MTLNVAFVTSILHMQCYGFHRYNLEVYVNFLILIAMDSKTCSIKGEQFWILAVSARIVSSQYRRFPTTKGWAKVWVESVDCGAPAPQPRWIYPGWSCVRRPLWCSRALNHKAIREGRAGRRKLECQQGVHTPRSSHKVSLAPGTTLFFISLW